MRIRTFVTTSAIVSVAIVIVAFFVLKNRAIYRQNFGDHAIEIWISSNDAGSDIQKIHGSYFQRGSWLMRGYNSVALPETFETPSFTTVVDKSNHLICVYDNNDYGFLMIVDQSDHDWYIGGMSGGGEISGDREFSSLEEWQKHFQTLHESNPEIPYGEYFAD